MAYDTTPHSPLVSTMHIIRIFIQMMSLLNHLRSKSDSAYNFLHTL